MSRTLAVCLLPMAVIAGNLPRVSVAAGPQATLSCPATLDSSHQPPAGARMMGPAVNGKTSLTHASMATGTPADQDANALAEFEQDDEQTQDGIVTYTYYYEATAQSPLSVICAYGAQQGAKPSLLLLPVPAGTKGNCKFRAPVAQGQHDTPSSMTCSAH